MRTSIVALALCVICGTAFAIQPTPLSVINEPESFKDDPEAKQADLAYRVCIRPWFASPIAMKIYITINQKVDARNPDEALVTNGRFVVKCVENGTTNKLLKREVPLSHKQVMDLLSVIRSQELFNLGKAPQYTPEDIASDASLDEDSWSFERLQPKPDSRYPDLPLFTSIRRVRSDRGPAKEVFSAFSVYASKLIGKTPTSGKRSGKVK